MPNFHLFFLLQLTRFLGFFPQANFSGNHKNFDLINATFLSTADKHEHCLDEQLSEVLFSLLNTSIERYSKLEISGKTRNRLLDSILQYYTLHLDGFTPVKSLAVLREIFH